MSTPSTGLRFHRYGRAAAGGALPLALVRDVWALVTRSPQLGMRPIGDRLGVSSSQVSRAMRFLRDAGYIEFEDKVCGTRRIIVPLIEVPS